MEILKYSTNFRLQRTPWQSGLSRNPFCRPPTSDVKKVVPVKKRTGVQSYDGNMDALEHGWDERSDDWAPFNLFDIITWSTILCVWRWRALNSAQKAEKEKKKVFDSKIKILQHVCISVLLHTHFRRTSLFGGISRLTGPWLPCSLIKAVVWKVI